MTDPMQWNDPRRLFELWKELSGEDLVNTEQQTNKEMQKR